VAARRWVIWIVAVLVVWMGGYAWLTREPDATAYRQTCVQAAQGALDGLVTARMSTDDGLLPPYRSAMDDDAQKLIEQARGQLGAAVPPDERSQRRRDTLIPLLDQSEALHAQLAKAESPGDVADVTARITALEKQLRDFVDGNR
jgi:hypothetical protein